MPPCNNSLHPLDCNGSHYSEKSRKDEHGSDNATTDKNPNSPLSAWHKELENCLASEAADINSKIGLFHFHALNDAKTALVYHERARRACIEKLSETSSANGRSISVQLGIILTDKGNAHERLKDHETALNFYNSALAIYEEIGLDESSLQVVTAKRFRDRLASM